MILVVSSMFLILLLLLSYSRFNVISVNSFALFFFFLYVETYANGSSLLFKGVAVFRISYLLVSLDVSPLMESYT